MQWQYKCIFSPFFLVRWQSWVLWVFELATTNIKYKQRHFGLAGTQTSYFNIHPDHFFEELHIVVYHSFKNQTGSAHLTENGAPIRFDYTEKPKIFFFFLNEQNQWLKVQPGNRLNWFCRIAGDCSRTVELCQKIYNNNNKNLKKKL